VGDGIKTKMSVQQKIAQKRKEIAQRRAMAKTSFLMTLGLIGGVCWGYSILTAKSIAWELLQTKTIIVYKAEAKEPQEPILEVVCGLNDVDCNGETTIGEFTSYSSDDGFTPGKIMANGKVVSEGMIAFPTKYSFGTKIEVLGKVYECADRMAKRFRDGEYFDIYSNDIQSAKSFGRRKLSFKVL